MDNSTTSASNTTETWHSQLPADLTYEHNGKAIPVREAAAIKNMPDLGTLAKSYLDAQSEIGRRVRIPAKDAKAQEVASFMQRLGQAGFLPAVPEAPDSYEIDQPEYLPAGVSWNDEWVKQARDVFHKNRFTQEQVRAAIELHQQLVGSMASTYKASFESGMEALKKDWGSDFSANAELATRAGHFIFGKDQESQEFFDRTGINNDPRFLKIMALIGKHLEGDDGFLAAGRQSAPEPDDEAQDIMRNPRNPKHDLWKRGDPRTIEYIRELFAKKYPEAERA
ncbi:MAG TPA: hypothetical protein VGH16_16315 [Candidatus Binatia bacterium]